MAQDAPRTRRRMYLTLGIIMLALTVFVLWYWHPWQRPAPIVIHKRINPRDGAVMAWVPGGSFRMGDSGNDIRDVRNDIVDAIKLRDWTRLGDAIWRRSQNTALSIHTVYQDGYWMYINEVTVAQYRKFCQATKRQMPSSPGWKWQDMHPIVKVSWTDAKAYADWAGVSLPSEAEWEKAARGGDDRIYPWSDVWPPPMNAGNFADETCKKSPRLQDWWYMTWVFIDNYNDNYMYVSPVGNFEANPYGIYDLAGNISEWCSDWWDEQYYQHSPIRNPRGPAHGTSRMLRGGSWMDGTPGNFRSSGRDASDPMMRYSGIGFRCVMHAPGP